jgi:hypothetical protein
MSDTPKNWVDDFWDGNPVEEANDPIMLKAYRDDTREVLEEMRLRLLSGEKIKLVDESGLVIGEVGLE